jgi:hypothetical protein
MGEECEYYNVEKIRNRRFSPKRQQMFYLVKWENYPEEDNSWEPEHNLESVAHLLQHFNAKWEKREQKRAKTKKDKLDRMAATKKLKESAKVEANLDAHKASREAYKQLEITDQTDDVPPTAERVDETLEPTPSQPVERKDDDRAKALESPLESSEVPMDIIQEPPRKINFTHMLLQPSLSFDQPSKILGCHKQGEALSYLVLFRRRADGQVPCAGLVSHKELSAVAPGLVSQYLLYNLTI